MMADDTKPKPTVVKPPMTPNKTKAKDKPVPQAAPGPAATGSADTGPKPGGKKFVGTEDSKPSQKKVSRKPAGRPVPLEKQLTEFFEGIGTIVFLVNNEDGMILTEAAPKLAHAYAKLAQKNAVVKKIIENMLETSAWSEAAVVTGMVALPIAQNHGLIPTGLPLPSFDMSMMDDE